jgi:hypothetical protein
MGQEELRETQDAGPVVGVGAGLGLACRVLTQAHRAGRWGEGLCPVWGSCTSQEALRLSVWECVCRSGKALTDAGPWAPTLLKLSPDHVTLIQPRGCGQGVMSAETRLQQTS